MVVTDEAQWFSSEYFFTLNLFLGKRNFCRKKMNSGGQNLGETNSRDYSAL